MKDRNEQRDAALNEFFAQANEPLPDREFLRTLCEQLAKAERERRWRSVAVVVCVCAVAAALAPTIIGFSDRFGAIVARGYPALNAFIESPIGWIALSVPALWMIGRTLRT